MLPVSDLSFHHRLGRVLEHLGDEEFWPRLIAFLRESISFNSWVALIFHTRQSPYTLGAGDENIMDETLFSDYLQSFYALDPFYLLSLGDYNPGLHRLDDVAPEHFKKTEYYQRYFKLNVVEDEVQILLPVPPHGTLSLALGAHKRFSDQEIGWLLLFLPWLMPVMKAAARLQLSARDLTPITGISLEAQLQKRATTPLTERETQIVILLLAGHSTKSIAARLHISPETVKVHRRNLYEKLNVSSQAEVFALFMRQLNTD